MALKIIDHGTNEYRQMIKLRDDILRKPLGLGFTPQELEKEKDNMLIGAFEDEDMLGCCMLVEENPETVRLRQMAVLNDLQGKGIGRALMNFAENLARDRGYKILSMHARKNAIGFYEKMGYKVANINIDPWQNPIPIRLQKENAAKNTYENIFRWGDFFEQLVFPLQKNKSLYLETQGIRSDADVYYPLIYDFKK